MRVAPHRVSRIGEPLPALPSMRGREPDCGARILAFFRLCALTLAAAVTFQGAAVAQRIPRFVGREDLVIPASRTRIPSVVWIGLRADGSIVVEPGGNMNAVGYQPDGASAGAVRTPGRVFVAKGMIGDTVWGIDPQTRMISLATSQSTVETQFVAPTTITLPSGDAVTYPPMMGSPGAYPLGLEPDGSLLVTGLPAGAPATWHRQGAAPNDHVPPIIHVTRNGTFQNVVGWDTPPTECRKVEFTFCNQRMTRVASDGRSFLAAEAAIDGPDSGTFRAVMIDVRGDTIYDRRFPYTPVAVSRHDADSAIGLLMARSASPAWTNHIKAAVHPTIYPPIVSIVVAADRSLWIEQPPTGTFVHWLVIDSTGVLSRDVRMPAGLRIRAIRGDTAWGAREDGPDGVTLVRMRVIPLP